MTARTLADLTLDDVRAVEDALKALAPSVEIVPSSDPRRVIVVTGLTASRAATGHGWDEAHARDNVSVALPAIVPSLLPTFAAAVPFAGAILGKLAAGFDHPTVFLAPAVERVPLLRLKTVCHEFGHQLQTAGGVAQVIGWCIAYGMHPEHRTLGAEGPCYACDLAFTYWQTGEDPDRIADRIAEGLKPYGADDALVRDVRRQLSSHVETLREGLCVAVRSVIVAVRVLTARGIEGLPALPPAT